MKIEFDNAIICDDTLKLTASHTEYVNLKRLNSVTPEQFGFKVKQLTKLCKENKVRLCKKQIKAMTAQLPCCVEAMTVYNAKFESLKTMLEAIVKEGLFAPTNANIRLKDAMALRNNINAMFYRSQILSCFMQLNHMIDSYLNHPRLSQFEKIYL